nr:putative ribonuclease H-like domain-containing protein [Tanacetum cinerariifolium]
HILTTARTHAQRGNNKHYAHMTLPNPQRHVVPTAVVTQVNAVRPVTTYILKTNVTRPRQATTVVTKPNTPPRRAINRWIGNMGMETKVPNLRSCFPNYKCINDPKKGNPQHALKDKGVIDSGCLRHKTGNMSYLSDFEELNAGYVAFGGNLKGGKNSSKGKIRTGNLDFDDVYFVKKLKFNLFSPGENQVLLRIPKENNTYNVDLKNIIPYEALTCLFAKATLDESNLWHRRFTWVFFVATKDETSPTLKTLITSLENQLSRKVKVIRSENETKFKNHDLNHFYEIKGIKREFSVPRTPQQNGIAKRKISTLIEAARTIIVDSLLPILFWAEAVNTACYVQNRVLMIKPHNKTLYELLHGRTPSIGFMRPFGCLVTILNTLNSLSKFNGKVDKGFLVRYSVSSKPFRVFNSRTRIVQETFHVNFLENKSNVSGSGPFWLFDIDTLTRTMNYQPVTTDNQSNPSAGVQEQFDAEKAGEEIVQQYVLFLIWSSSSTNPYNTDGDAAFDEKEREFEERKPESKVNVLPRSSAKNKKHDDKTKREARGKSHVESLTGYRNLSAEFEDFFNNNINEVNAAGNSVPVVGQIYTDSTNTFSDARPSNAVVNPTHGKYSNMDSSQLPDDPDMPELEDITYSNDEDNVSAKVDFNNLETSITKVRVLVDLPYGKRVIGTKWVFRNKNDERGIVVRNKARLVTQGHTQDEGINYKEVFAPVARIKAIRLFLAYASFMGFMVYQMDVKSAFVYGTIEEEVYVCQHLGFEDPDYPDKVYKVVKALYGLHQAPRAWYETLANYLLENGFQRAFEKLMQDKFQMSSMGVLTFFLGLQVKQKHDGIFISQDKFVAKILRKFGVTDGKSASTPIDTEKPLLKDPDCEDVDVHTYRSMIGSLMCLTSSRPDIMFAFWTTVAVKKVNDVTRLQALVDKKKLVVTKASIRDVLRLDDAEGVECKGFSGVETPLFEGMLVAQEIVEGKCLLEMLMLLKVLPKEKRVEHLEKDKITQALEITKLKSRGKKLERINKASKLKRLKKGRMIAEMDVNVDVVLEVDKDVAADIVKDVQDNDIKKSADDQRRKAEFQAKIYKIDLEHANKVLSMQEKETKPTKVQEVVDVVTTTKIITDVFTATSDTITAASINITTAKAQVPTVITTAAPLRLTAAPRRRKEEDLKALWRLVKERFATTKPNNFFDDFLLTTLRAMVENPDIHVQIWKNQTSVHGEAKVKSWKLLESCGVQIITLTTTQLLYFEVDVAEDLEGKRAKTIKEEVYVCQPPGFKDPNYPDKVYKVVKALYGLHQAPKVCESGGCGDDEPGDDEDGGEDEEEEEDDS